MKMDNADQLISAMTPSQITDLRDCPIARIAALPCYNILWGLVSYQNPHRTYAYLHNIIETAWSKLQQTEIIEHDPDPTPYGKDVAPIRPMPSDKR